MLLRAPGLKAIICFSFLGVEDIKHTWHRARSGPMSWAAILQLDKTYSFTTQAVDGTQAASKKAGGFSLYT